MVVVMRGGPVLFLTELVLAFGAPAALLWNGYGLAAGKIGPNAGWAAILASGFFLALETLYFLASWAVA